MRKQLSLLTLLAQSNLMHPDHASDFLQDLKAIQAESIGWLPLGEGAYLHCGDDNQDYVIDVVGIAKSD